MLGYPRVLLPFSVGLAGWLVPGAGYMMLNEKKHAIIIFATIAFTFFTGLYISSIGVVDPIGSRLAYAGQLMNSPAVILLGCVTAGGGYPVYGRPNEIGQIYTTISGMLNLLCIVNCIYMSYIRQIQPARRE